MSITLAVLIGILTSVGVYLMLHRTLTRIVLGIGMLGNAVNLMIIAAGGPPGEAPDHRPRRHRSPIRFPRRSSSPRS